jgi:opacity protein-like surface antigen
MTLAGAVAALLFVALPAVASQDVQSELAEVRELVKGLQQEVEAQQEQLAHQGELLEDAQAVVQRTQQEQDALSGLSKFLEAVEFDGNVAGSYIWNANRPDADRSAGGIGNNTGNSGAFYPYHPDHNSFQLDHVWFGMGKPATEESRGGFRFDLAFGQTASSMQTTFGGWRRAFGADAASEIYVAQAYVEYLAPLGEASKVTFGKFAALTGVESLDSTKNFHITHSNLYNLLQPIDHVGVMASAQAGPLELIFGYVNTHANRLVNTWLGNGIGGNPDDNSEKSYIGGLNFAQDNFEVRSTVLYGADSVGGAFTQNGEKYGVVDVVMTMDPSDQLSLWVNGDYAWVQGRRMAGYGIGAGARVAVSDRMGVALRGEYLKDKEGNNLSALFLISPGGTSSEIYQITGTADYTLVENLVLRLEGRWDQVRYRRFGFGTYEFPKTDTRFSKHQVTAGAQVVYNF